MRQNSLKSSLGGFLSGLAFLVAKNAVHAHADENLDAVYTHTEGKISQNTSTRQIFFTEFLFGGHILNRF